MTSPHEDLLGIWFGTMTLGDTVSAGDAQVLIQEALNAGIRKFDTANVYADGRSEEILGQTLGNRDDVVVASKVGLQRPTPGESGPLSTSEVRRCVKASLKRLQRDRLDVLILHAPDRATDFEETAGALRELQSAGLVGKFGLSNFSSWQTLRMTALLGDPGEVVLSQQMYNLLARRIEDEFLEMAQLQGPPVVAYNPLAGGLLTGRYQADPTPPETGRFGASSAAARYRDRYWNDTMLASVRSLKTVADAYDLPMPEVAIRWVLSRPGVGGLVLGASKPAQLHSNVQAASAGPLSSEIIVQLDGITENLTGPMPRYNR